MHHQTLNSFTQAQCSETSPWQHIALVAIASVFVCMNSFSTLSRWLLQWQNVLRLCLLVPTATAQLSVLHVLLQHNNRCCKECHHLRTNHSIVNRQTNVAQILPVILLVTKQVYYRMEHFEQPPMLHVHVSLHQPHCRCATTDHRAAQCTCSELAAVNDIDRGRP